LVCLLYKYHTWYTVSMVSLYMF